MRPLLAVKAAASAFKSTWTEPGPAYHSGAEAAYWRDWFRNGWAAVSTAFGAFWGALRDWGGTDYARLAADAAANPHSGRGLRLICENGAAVPVIAYREATKDGDEDEADPENPALLAVERTGWGALFTSFVWGMYAGGECFFRQLAPDGGPNEGVARRIQILRNERLARIDYDRDGDPTTYHFTRLDGRGGTDEYPAEEVLHVKAFNPEDERRGMPLLVSARRALTIVAEADAWNRGIARGGGRIPGYFEPTPQMLEHFRGQIPPDKVREAQTAADEAHRDRQAANLPMVMSGAFTYQQAGISPREADWLKGRNVAMREIAAVLGVPATLLADEKGGSLTDAGVDSEVAALYKLTIQPLVTRLLAELTDWLCEEGTRLDADWDQVPALQEDIDAKFVRYTQASAAGGPLTRKEARVALGYDPVPKPEMQDEADTETVPPMPPDPPLDADEDPPDESEAVRYLRALPEGFWDADAVAERLAA